jgi:hypothetical protein
MVRRCILHSSWPSQSCRWNKDMDVFLFLLILIYNSYRFNHHFAGWRDLDKFSCGNFFLGWIPPVFYLTKLQLQVSRCISLSLVKELDFNVWANFLEFHRSWMMEQFSFAWHTYMRFHSSFLLNFHIKSTSSLYQPRCLDWALKSFTGTDETCYYVDFEQQASLFL